MSMTRRQFTQTAASAAAAIAVGERTAAEAADRSAPGKPAPETPAHDMSAMPAHWIGKEQIAFLIYPEFTALDMVGPHHMLTGLMGATVHIVAKTRDPVKSDTGLVFVPSATFAECPADLDIVCVPGGTQGTLAAMQDEATIRFLRDRGSRARFITSVCTGSLVLGAAGLLDGYRATSHWAAKPVLPVFGAIPSEGRVVRDRNRITGGGVTAGIDFGLSLVGQLRDRQYAEVAQLIAEYAPEPPYDAGTPARAPAEVRALTEPMFVDFLKQAEAVGRAAFARNKTL
ncbi:DJ-1/PfpI family protein [Rhodopseudomonas palustris]|uniref:DJ-1/PfpI family protein n=1 Tax=Rhodopseudomonas palustris TaxID=1076 RepID=UPI002ACDF9DD|nr:DJ-1/PfpI family protein [Rhodopseudomonas palustris]WQH01017.1 DJ-1/PfpI family protein [Rhodopseudomonas palustris]